MKNTMLAMVVCLAPACVIVPAETKRAVGSNATVGVIRTADWDGLSPGQKKEAYWQLVRAFCDLDFQFNGIPIPQTFVNDPHYEAAPTSSTAPVKSSTEGK